MRITVIGLGKIGLPLAVQFASKNHQVIGLDTIENRVHQINQGDFPFNEEMDLKSKLFQVVKSKNLQATTDAQSAISSADVVVVAVPLMTNKNGAPNFEIVDSVTRNIGDFVAKKTLICYETTLPIGTTRNRFAAEIEKRSNLKTGKDIYIVFSPERVFTGRVFSDLRKYPKVVGGVTQNCTAKGVEFYESVLDFDKRNDLARPNGVWSVESCESAEFIKLAETTYRDVNIGLANQFAMFANKLDIDIQQVIDTANSQPYSHIHQPGISVGGHCIPVYPHLYLLNDPLATIVKEARNFNDQMPGNFVKLLIESAGNLKGKEVLVLGVTYRPRVKEVAYSGAVELKKILLSLGAVPKFHDPLLNKSELVDLDLNPGEITDKTEIIILHTAHAEYAELNFSSLPSLKFFVDGRGIFGKGVRVLKF
jgi:nucleotide sugar dehydrogenase